MVSGQSGLFPQGRKVLHRRGPTEHRRAQQREDGSAPEAQMGGRLANVPSPTPRVLAEDTVPAWGQVSRLVCSSFSPISISVLNKCSHRLNI